MAKKSTLSNQFKQSTAVFGPVGSIGGFVSDVIQPISPVIHFLTGILAVASGVLFICLFFRSRHPLIEKAANYFTQCLILTAILSFFWVLGSGSENGFFADNFEAVAALQATVLDKNEVPETGKNDVTLLQQNVTALRLSIAANEIKPKAVSVEDHLINATVLFNVGDFRQAEASLDSVFAKKYIRYDLLRHYYEVVFHNYSGKQDSIKWKMSTAGLTSHPLLKLAELDFLYDGLDFYVALSKVDLGDPLLLAFAENMKARSLQADLNHYDHYESYVMNYWIPRMRRNEEMLGKNLVTIRRIFFDYPTSVKHYQEGSTHPEDGHTIWGWHSYDPKGQKTADYLWNRLLTGATTKAFAGPALVVNGTVTDSFGVPVAQLIVTDFDQFPSRGRADQVWMTTTDEQGRFSIRTGKGHLLRFDGSFADMDLKELFVIAEEGDSLRIKMER